MKGGTIPKVYTDEEILALMSVTLNTIPNLRRNTALNAFEISMLKTEQMHNMLDGFRDVFNDSDGILCGGAVSGGVLKTGFGITTIENLSGGTIAQLYDENDSTQCYTSGTAGWFSFNFGMPVVINRFVSEACLATNRDPSQVIVKASNTGAFSGEEVTLDTIAMTKGAQNDKTFTNTTAYMHYRFYLSGGTEVHIGFDELNFYNGVAEITEPEGAKQDIISISTTAEAQPTNTHVIILADDAAITLNTDLKFFASVDDGATWEQITLSDSGDYSATEIILTGSVAVAGTGTTIKYKIECTDADFEFYAVGLLWD